MSIITNSLASRKICPKLDKPKNGVVKQTGVYPGDKAVYKCNDGLLMFGKYTRTCLKNGVWSDSAPVCQRKIISCILLP